MKLPSHPLSCPLRREERAGNSRRVIWVAQLGNPKYSQAKKTDPALVSKTEAPPNPVPCLLL